ncbi:MAG: polyprenyl synthetase family protein [Myxococcales bacterium]|nr:polyprenyl synthetase family protein [Myxococcales bacterium]
MEENWLQDVVRRVDAHIEAFFDQRAEQARSTSPRARELLDAVRDLTMRGGKRLRPAALYAGFRAVDADASDSATLDASAALELLQAYLLIQDDWMDGDEERRGAPSVHAALAARHGDAHLGASLAILAGDVASGFAWELVARAPFPEQRLGEALELFGRTHFEVVCGQQLDLVQHPDVALVHHLKTGSYTVRGPLCLGGILAGASEAQLQALRAYGTPMGVAFQLRDDLLGAFGDRDAVGKPIGNDLRAGKHTSLVAEARELLQGEGRAALDAVLGRAGASDAEVARATEALLASGARERVENRLDQLLDEARAALDASPLTDAGVALLTDLIERIGRRDR